LSGTDYQVDAQVVHYAKDGSIAKTITMVNCWPSAVAAIDLDWSSNDQLEEFSVTWQYDYWKATDSVHSTT